MKVCMTGLMMAVAAVSIAGPKTVTLKTTGERLEYDLPSGLTAKIEGSTFKQIVAMDGKIHHPLSDKNCVITLRYSDGTLSDPMTVTVKGTAVAGKNPKPSVVPALQEWVGGDGFYEIPSVDDGLVIVVDSDSWDVGEPSLATRMEIFASDFTEQTGVPATVRKDGWFRRSHAKGMIYVTLDCNDEMLGKEGYLIDAGKSITIKATDPLGAFWATRTLLQVFKTDKNKFPFGQVRDYPQYPVRGFMYDVGRKPATLDAVYNVMKTMAWYKLNDLQLHLNDNYIWLHKYTKFPCKRNASDADKAAAIRDVLNEKPSAAGFRLENTTFKGLTSQNASYTKKEFGSLIDNSAVYGVNIVPELDVPGHALSFVKIRPDLMYKGPVHKEYDIERAAMLDCSSRPYKNTGRTYRDETLAFVKKVFDEYLDSKNGEKPVFRSSVVHIGTDEYYGDAEDYRAFADSMLKYIKSKGHTPRLWGSLRAKPGKTPVENDGVQMHVWSRDWQRPAEAIAAGYDIINILDADMYIVPNGRGNVGAYGDDISRSHLYGDAWQPHIMRQFRVTPGNPKLLGAQFAVWTDHSFYGDPGLSDYELYDRIRKTCSVIAEKTWATGRDKSFDDFSEFVEKVGVPPNTNPTYIAKDEVVERDFSKVNLTKPLATGLSAVAPNYTAEFTVRRTDTFGGEQVLVKGPTGAIKAVQAETKKVGISRDGWDFSFDYSLRSGKTTVLRFVATGRKLELFVKEEGKKDFVKIGEPKRNHYPESCKYNYFVLPLEQLSCEKKYFHGKILGLNVRVEKPLKEENKIDRFLISVHASSEQNTNVDGPASWVCDGDKSTFWHSKYSPTMARPPHKLFVGLKTPQQISAVRLVQRQNGENGRILSAELSAKVDGVWKTVASVTDAANDSSPIELRFCPVETDTLRLTITKSVQDFATLAEFEIYK